MISEVCYKIKEKRRVLGYSIEDVVNKTKLHPTVIEDIENNNFNNISPIYLKGFIKMYASFLEVDIGEALDEIGSSNKSAKAAKVSEVQDTELVSKSKSNILKGLKEKAKMLSPELKRKIFIGLAGVVGLWFSFIAIKFVVVNISKAFKHKPKITENVPIETAVTSSVASKPVPVEEVAGVTVALTAKKRCFLRVTVDGKILFEGILNSGSVETWKGKEEIELKISDGSAIQLEVNGRAIPILASIRKPIKSLKITSSGISVDK